MQLLRTYAAAATFLGSYFALTVLGNLIYFLPLGDELGSHTIVEFSIGKFSTAGSPTYWILLLLPFALVPPAVVAVKRLAAPIGPIAARLPALSKAEYSAALAVCYAYVAMSLWRADAIALLLRGTDFSSAVQERFALIDLLGFWPLVVLKSILVALSCYGFVRALTSRDRFWLAASGFNLVAMSVALTLLNMKWPLVLFYLVHLAAIMLVAERKLMPAAVFATLACVSYFSVSFLLVRAVPAHLILAPESRHQAALPVEPAPAAAPAPAPAPPPAPVTAPASATAAVDRLSAAALAAAGVVNRMAQPFPYYVESFADAAGKCGTLTTRLLREPSPCQPSNLVYAQMFSDQFAGVGTAPQAPHVTGFALNGWSGAIIELLATSVVLGLFAATAGSTSAEQATITVLGVLTGYFFSQLPFEGPLIYDHGVVWWLLPLLAFAAAKQLTRKTVAT
jgi:hypothetical protein